MTTFNYHIKEGAVSVAEAFAMALLRARIYGDAALYEAVLRCVRSRA